MRKHKYGPELKVGLAKARGDTAAAIALAAEREPPGLGGTVDRLFSSRTPSPTLVGRHLAHT
jgi:hypothetical protein